jgi:hypothetical protein
MKDWLKGIIAMVAGSVLYNVIPVWTTQYLLSLPNPFYSIGAVLQGIGTSYESLSSLNVDLFTIFDTAKQYIGIALIVYALYLAARTFYKK